MRLVFTTKLSKEECIHRITTHAKKSTFLAYLVSIINSEKVVYYKINKDNLMLKRPIFNRNSYQRTFRGKFIENEGKTLIEGTFRIYLFVKVFMILWFAGWIGIGGVLFIASLQEIFNFNIIGGSASGDPIWGTIFFPLGILFGIAIIKIGLAFSKEQENEIIEFINKTLEGKMEFKK